MNQTPTILETVQAAFASSGLTQRELADRCGLAYPHMSAYLSGRKRLRIDTLQRICNALGLALAHKSTQTE